MLISKRLFMKVLILLCLGYFLGGKAEASNAWSWPLARHDPRNSAYSAAEGPNIPEVKWERKLDSGIYEEPVVNSARWIYAVAGNKLYAFDEEGDELFSPISLTEEVYAEKVYSLGLSTNEKTLYVGLATNEGAAVAAFDAQQGSLKWFFNEIAGEAVESFNVDDNVIYFGTNRRASGEGGRFYALKDEGSHASLLWDIELFKDWKEISFPYSSPIHGDSLFITAVGEDSEAGVLAVNKNNGSSV